MKPKLNLLLNLGTLAILSLAEMLSVSTSPAASFEWLGASGVNNFWATPGNWAPSGPPGSADSVIFGADASGLDSVTVNNTVGVSTSIATLSYTNSTSGAWHVTSIPAGITLAVSGNVTVGGGNATGLSTSAAMAGGGTFLATGTTFNLGNNAASGSATPGTLDLSGLSTFVYSSSSGTIGLGTLGSRSSGNLTLAAGSNNITAGTISMLGATGTGSSQALNLGGGSNIINASTINVGTGRSTTSVQFSGVTGGLRLRGTGGTDADRSTIRVGNRDTGGTGNLTTTGNIFVNAHPVDMKLATLTLGQMSRAGTEVNFVGVGVFQFDQGTVDATAIAMGVCSGNSTNSTAIGSLTVGAAGTVLAGSVSLANVSATAAGTSASGTLNVFGGIVNCTGSITKTTTTASTGIVAVASGALIVGGTLGSSGNPIDSLNLTNGALTIRAGASPSAIVAGLTTDGSTNVINISAVPAITSYPAQFQVIKYSGAIGGVGFNNNLGLGTLPAASPAFAGYLSNNTASLSIDLVITSGPSPAQQVTWAGTQSGAWDTTTLNWRAGANPTNYNNSGDFVTFNDTASTTTVYLATATLTPGGITVSNSSLAYTFTGNGKLSGGTDLTKQGSGTLILNNGGVNDFGGAISLTGTLQFGSGGTNGNLPSTVNVTNNGTLVFNRSDNFTGANVISGTGAVVQNGMNTLTLTGNNSFTGALTANSGVVRLTSVAASGTGPITANNGGTVVLGAQHRNSSIVLAGGVLGSSASLNPLTNDLTAAAGTASTIYFADPQSLAAADGFEMAWSNTLHGSGSILVATVTNDPSPDGGNGFRFRGTTASDFSGTITFSNNVKGELQTVVAGPFSPAGTGRLRLYCGGIFGTNGLLGPVLGGYSELNLRNNSTSDSVLGNDIELLGTGIAFLNPLGSAPDGNKITLGNLKMGGGQEMGVYLSGAPAHVIAFSTVMLTGGDARISPKTPGFGATASAGSDLSLGSISESAASGITMNGLRTLFLTGTNTYSGTTTISNGTVIVTGSNLGAGNVTVYGGTLGGTGLIKGPVTIAPGGTLSPGSSIGILSVANKLSLSGTSVMDLNKSGVVLTSDAVTNITTLTVGGTLMLNVTGDPLTAGDIFKLYSFSSANGAFVAISPANPAAGLFWDTSHLTTDGTLRVVSAIAPQPHIVSIAFNGTQVIISGTNGTAGGNYYVLSSTNVALPLANWPPISTNQFDAVGQFTATNAVTVQEPQRFYLLRLP